MIMSTVIRMLIMFSLSVALIGSVLASDISTQEQFFSELDAPLMKKAEVSTIFPINENVLSLKKLSEHDSESAREQLQELQKLALEFNEAEQYLLHIIRANISNVRGQEDKVVNWLNKAITLEPKLSKKQLNSPDFASAYLLLAKIYQQQSQYQKAYDSKKSYIKKNSAHLKQQNQLRMKRLNEKYQLAKKHEDNELLKQNNELKHFQLANVESQRNIQNLNIMITLAAGILFLVLLLRQFKIRRALKILTKTDSLTKLANRREFFAQGYRAMERAITKQSELCVLVIDIDHFKQVNDTLGHDVGDEIIYHVAQLAAETMRSRDILARIGGEEFAAILPDANIGQARAIAERIREKIQDSEAPVQQSLSISVSIGLANIADADTSFDHLLHLGDTAMYQAKINGRNCVRNFEPTSEE